MTGATATGGLLALPRQRTAPPAGAERRPNHGRDQYVDALRALALVRVVTYHTYGWIWLPVLFPSMAVMFAPAKFARRSGESAPDATRTGAVADQASGSSSRIRPRRSRTAGLDSNAMKATHSPAHRA